MRIMDSGEMRDEMERREIDVEQPLSRLSALRGRCRMTEVLRLEVKRIFRMKSFWIILIVFAVNTIMWNTRW